MKESGRNTEYKVRVYVCLRSLDEFAGMSGGGQEGSLSRPQHRKSETQGASPTSVRSIKEGRPARGLGGTGMYSASQRPTHAQVEVGLTAADLTDV